MLIRLSRLRSKPFPAARLLPSSKLRDVTHFRRRQLSVAAPVCVGRQNDDEQLKVKYYDEDVGDESSRRPSKEQAVENHVEDLKARITELENEIKQFKLPTRMPEHIAQRLFGKRFSAEDQIDLEGDLGTLEIFAHQIRPQSTLHRDKRIYLDRLNTCLDNASLAPDDETARKELWRWYERSKTNVSELLELMPDAAWGVLWLSQSVETISNPDRTSHLLSIAQDMVFCGKTLTEEQSFALIEGLFQSGRRDEALERWELDHSSKSHREPHFLELGIRLRSKTNDLQRAVELLDELFSSYPNCDYRILMAIITACVATENLADIETAWGLYMRLRNRLGHDMTAADYDVVCLAFLRVGRKDHALAVFRDMMLCGSSSNKTQTFFNTAVSRIEQFASESAKEVNEVSLEITKHLPRRFQNKFFYASWLKRLIGMNEVDAAAQVIELMYERGISPDAKHMNGIIGAWLRDGSVSARRQAEDVAWTMIKKRVDFVQTRRGGRAKQNTYLSNMSVRGKTDQKVHVQPFIDRALPSATMETFSVLVQHYLRREMFDRVKDLRNLLVDAEIPMNSYFMNHLLWAEIRNRSHRDAWARFEVMARTVVPDMETFTILWECMKFHVDLVRNGDLTGFPTPRQLFARMTTWFNKLPSQARNTAVRDLDLDAYHDIIRSFCLNRDFEGAFAAMHYIEQAFQLHPDARTVRVVLLQIARLTMSKPKSAPHARAVSRKLENDKVVAKTTELLEILTRTRREELATNGHHFDDLSTLDQARENHRALLQLVFTIIAHRQSRQVAIVAPSINRAAAEMGVALFDVEESMALTVQ